MTYSLNTIASDDWSIDLHFYNDFANDINEFHGDVEISFGAGA